MNEMNCRLILISRGDCSTFLTADALSDLMGYEPDEALKLANNIPVCIAENLSLEQADLLAHAFDEYGVEIQIRTESDTVHDFDTSSSNSCYTSEGVWMAEILAVSAAITAFNRVSVHQRPMGMRMFGFPGGRRI